MDNRVLITRIINLDSIIERGEKLPRKFSYALTKNLMGLQELYKPYEKERGAILEKYARKGENGEILYLEGQTPDIPESSQAEYGKEMEELLGIQVNFEPHRIPLEDLPENIDAKTMCMIEFMVDA